MDVAAGSDFRLHSTSQGTVCAACKNTCSVLARSIDQLCERCATAGPAKPLRFANGLNDSAAAAGLPLALHWWAGHRAERTEHAAVAGLRPQRGSTRGTIEEHHAGVFRHRLFAAMAAMRAGEGAEQDGFAHGFSASSFWPWIGRNPVPRMVVFVRTIYRDRLPFASAGFEKASKSLAGTPNASASLQILTSAMLRCPRSTPPR